MDLSLDPKVNRTVYYSQLPSRDGKLRDNQVSMYVYFGFIGFLAVIAFVVLIHCFISCIRNQCAQLELDTIHRHQQAEVTDCQECHPEMFEPQPCPPDPLTFDPERIYEEAAKDPDFCKEPECEPAPAIAQKKTCVPRFYREDDNNQDLEERKSQKRVTFAQGPPEQAYIPNCPSDCECGSSTHLPLIRVPSSCCDDDDVDISAILEECRCETGYFEFPPRSCIYDILPFRPPSCLGWDDYPTMPQQSCCDDELPFLPPQSCCCDDLTFVPPRNCCDDLTYIPLRTCSDDLPSMRPHCCCSDDSSIRPQSYYTDDSSLQSQSCCSDDFPPLRPRSCCDDFSSMRPQCCCDEFPTIRPQSCCDDFLSMRPQSCCDDLPLTPPGSCCDDLPLIPSRSCCDDLPFIPSRSCCDDLPLIPSRSCCDDLPLIQTPICCDDDQDIPSFSVEFFTPDVDDSFC